MITVAISYSLCYIWVHERRGMDGWKERERRMDGWVDVKMPGGGWMRVWTEIDEAWA